MNQNATISLSERLVPILLLSGLLLLSYVVVRPFLVPLLWAAILAYATWPVYRRLLELLQGRANLAALTMTLLLMTLIVLPMIWFGVLLQDEVREAFRTLVAFLTHGPQPLPDFIAGIPVFGERLQDWLNQLTSDPENLEGQLTTWVRQWLLEALGVLGDIGRNALKLGFTLFTVFFCYRDGDNFVRQVRQVLGRFLGSSGGAYLGAVGDTARAVVNGLVLTALAQGTLAGIGYAVAGVQAPVLFGIVTALLALVPFGTPLVWGGVGVGLLWHGEIWGGIGVLLWGALVVSTVDNFIRPWVISSATRIPFVIVLFGVIGGLAAFGLVGLFVGPVVLAVLLAVWREWLEEHAADY